MTDFTLGCAEQRFVDVAFHPQRDAAAESAVGGDDDLRAAIVDPFLERLGAEAAEDHAVRGADARAGQHGDDRLGNHRQVDHHAVARLHAVLLQDVGQEADLAVQLQVGERDHLARLALEDDRGLVAQRAFEMTVQAVVAGVEFSANEPLREGWLPDADFFPGAEPLEIARGFLPEFVGILQRGAIELLILLEAADARGLGEFRRGLEDALFIQDRFDVVHGLRLF